MEIVSQARANLYNIAFDLPRDRVAELDNLPAHLLEMLHERAGRNTSITNGDIVDHFAPTFDEARMLGVLEARTLKVALSMLDDGLHQIDTLNIPLIVIDLLYDHIPGAQIADALDLSDVVAVLQSSLDR